MNTDATVVDLACVRLSLFARLLQVSCENHAYTNANKVCPTHKSVFVISSDRIGLNYCH